MKRQVIVYKDKLRVENYPTKINGNKQNLYKVRLAGNIGYNRYAFISRIFDIGGNRIVLLSRNTNEGRETLDNSVFPTYRTSCMSVDTGKYLGCVQSSNVIIRPLIANEKNDDCVVVEGTAPLKKMTRTVSSCIIGSQGALATDLCDFNENNENTSRRYFKDRVIKKLNQLYVATMQLTEQEYVILVLNNNFDVVDIEKRKGVVALETDIGQFKVEHYAKKYQMSKTEVGVLCGSLEIPNYAMIEKKEGKPLDRKMIVDYIKANQVKEK